LEELGKFDNCQIAVMYSVANFAASLPIGLDGPAEEGLDLLVDLFARPGDLALRDAV